MVACVRVFRVGIVFERAEEFLGLAPMHVPAQFVVPSGAALKHLGRRKVTSADRSKSDVAVECAAGPEAPNESEIARLGMLRSLPRACL